MENPHPNPKRKMVFRSYSRQLLVLMMLLQFHDSQTEQTYVNNKQLDCDKNYTSALGFVCNNTTTLSSCASYLTLRSNPKHNSAVTIGNLVGADPTEIARINNISYIDPIPTDTLVIVPLNCSCSAPHHSYYYQHNTSYVLSSATDTYFSIANNTYQGLTTCQSLKDQNPYDYRNLLVGMRLTIPLRCACPSPSQTASGFRYLLTYLITWRDTVESIAQAFGADNQSIFQANLLSPDDLIFPFTPILVPLRSPPTYNTNNIYSSSPSPPPPPSVPLIGHDSHSSLRRWIFVGTGIAAAVLFIFSLLLWFFIRRRPSPKAAAEKQSPGPKKEGEEAENKLRSVSSQGVRYAIGWLTVYELEELQEATGYFAEANRIKGSVYRGRFKGDDAVVKIMKGDVSAEMNILKQINHSNIIRLSGFCVHQDNTYLVYEYAERGSLIDCLINHHNKTLVPVNSNSTYSTTTVLSWKQRVQIAYDVADALNYLHNYSNPPYIHMNLKSSNILLDGNLRAKISNFGQARTTTTTNTVEQQHMTSTSISSSSNSNNQEEQLERHGAGGLLQLTKHVVGTHGYMAPEYIENGLITSKIDVFAFGVVMLELLSGREAAAAAAQQHKHVINGDADKMNSLEEGGKDETDNNGNGNELLLYSQINVVLGGEKVREKLREFIDPCMRVHDRVPAGLGLLHVRSG